MNRPAVIDRATLPTAVEPLQDMVLEMAAQLDGLRTQFDAQMESLRHQLAELRRRLFGPRSEAIHAGQGELWSETVEVPVPPEAFREVEAHRRRQPGRAAIGEHLPRRRVEHDLSADEKASFAAVERIGEEVSEMLEYLPARLEVIQNVRLKYRCERADGSSTIRTATAQGSPIAKSNAGPGLLAHVMVSKYLDHCPLARQQRILARDGVVIARQTLCDRVLDGAELLSVLMPVLHRHVLASPVIFTDDTTLALQAPGKTVTARMWAYIWPAAIARMSTGVGRRWRRRHCTTSRSIAAARTRILGDWRGYLQADDYSGYHASFREGVTHVACWAHARRKYFDVVKAMPKGARPGLAHHALRFIGLIYRIEGQIAEADPDVRRQLRQQRTKRVLAWFHRWLTAHAPTLLPKSPLAKAFAYCGFRPNVTADSEIV
ncbi:IS66 family transposase [Aromatoleum aromaticum]|nr:IS66 family transposase [Aromatoleum aromaticum]